MQWIFLLLALSFQIFAADHGVNKAGASKSPRGTSTQVTTPAPAPEFDPVIRSKALSSSVRIRKIDAHGSSMGSGTIIDSREGEALIVTCGHIFRGYQPKTDRVLVDYFKEGHTEPVEYRGKVLDFNLDDKSADLGLVTIRLEKGTSVVATSALVEKEAKVAPLDPVFSVGCAGGEIPPKLISSRVTVIDKFLGPGNIVCMGVPKQGRSGGGLFNARGELIGVTNAADEVDGEGLYCSYQEIHDFLEKKLGKAYSKFILKKAD